MISFVAGNMYKPIDTKRQSRGPCSTLADTIFPALEGESDDLVSRDVWFWYASLCPVHVNPLRAKFVRENINKYFHFLSFLHTNKIQVVEIPPRVKQGPAYSTNQ